MKYKMYALLISLVSLSLQCGDIVHYARNAQNDFLIKNNHDEMMLVRHHQVDKSIRDLNPDKLAAVLQSGSHYLKATELSDGSYALKMHGKIKGGGPATAAALYWITKSLCYGTAAAGTATLVVTTAGAGAALLTGGAATIAGGAIAGGAGGAVIAGVTAAEAAGVVAGGVAAAAAADAALVTGGVVASAGGVAGAVAAVEAASMGAFAVGMWLPLP